MAVLRSAPLVRAPRVRTSAVPALLGLALVLGFYVWTATTNPSTYPSRMTAGGEDYSNLETDAFLHGRVSLVLPPQAAGHRPHDLSLYRGRYYLYWGPTPVLTAFAPARLLGHRLPEPLAVALYAYGALLASLALLRWLLERLLPGTPGWMLALGGLALATSSVLPFVLRRPTIYEVAITAGLCFLMLGVLCVLSGGLGERVRRGRLALGSLSLGLAAGARPDLALSGLLLVAVLPALMRRPELRSAPARARAVALLLGPMALCGLLLAAYNLHRFGSVTEFGLHYQLNQRDLRPHGPLLARLLPSLYWYVLAPPRLTLAFPFVHLPPPPRLPGGATPAGYHVEHVAGLVPDAPIVLALAAGLPVALRSRRPPVRRLSALAALLTLLALVLLLAVGVAVLGATMRYEADFAMPLLVAALALWVLLSRQARSRAARRALLAGGAALIAWGALVGVAISFTGYTNGLRRAHPRVYARLEALTSPLPTAAARLAGRPLLTQAWAPGGRVRARAGYGTFDAGRHLAVVVGWTPATLTVVSPDVRTARLEALVAGDARLQARADGRPVPVRATGDGRVQVDLPLRRGLNGVALAGPGVALRELRLLS